MVGSVGVYRRPAGIDPKHARGAQFSKDLPKSPQLQRLEDLAVIDENAAKKLQTIKDVRATEFEKFTGAPYFDHAAIVIASNPDSTVDLEIVGVPSRDVFSRKVVQKVKVDTTLSTGVFVPNPTIVSTPATTVVKEGNE